MHWVKFMKEPKKVVTYLVKFLNQYLAYFDFEQGLTWPSVGYTKFLQMCMKVSKNSHSHCPIDENSC